MVNSIIAKIKAEYDSMNYLLSGYTLQSKTNTILNLLQELAKDQQYSTTANNAIGALFHTINKEVKFAVDAHNAMTKRNAAKIRKKEYQDQANDAISQIHQDIFSILHAEH